MILFISICCQQFFLDPIQKENLSPHLKKLLSILPPIVLQKKKKIIPQLSFFFFHGNGDTICIG